MHPLIIRIIIVNINRCKKKVFDLRSNKDELHQVETAAHILCVVVNIELARAHFNRKFKQSPTLLFSNNNHELLSSIIQWQCSQQMTLSCAYLKTIILRRIVKERIEISALKRIV